jgi:hypothetical protein
MCLRDVICGLLSSTNIRPHYLLSGTMYEKKLANMKCLFWFSLHLYETFLILRLLSEIWSKLYIVIHAKYPLFLSDFNENLNVLSRFLKNTLAWNFMKIRPVEADLFYAGRKDRHDS